MPDTASLGTIQRADTAQLPQSTRPVADVVTQLGWFCGSRTVGRTVATRRAPEPP